MITQTVNYQIDLSHTHPQVLEHFPNFDYHHPLEPERMDYRRGDNVTGHQQRAFLIYWGIEAGKRGDITLDLGGAGVWMPWVLSSDIVRAGQTHPTYGGTYHGVHLALDAANLEILGDDTFGAVMGNHIAEHLPCHRLVGDVSLILPSVKRSLPCDNSDVLYIIRNHWIRSLKPGGILALIVPDDAYSDTYAMDKSHTHAFSAREFYDQIVSKLEPAVETVEFDTFNNHFSFNWVARKR